MDLFVSLTCFPHPYNLFFSGVKDLARFIAGTKHPIAEMHLSHNQIRGGKAVGKGLGVGKAVGKGLGVGVLGC